MCVGVGEGVYCLTWVVPVLLMLMLMVVCDVPVVVTMDEGELMSTG